MNPRVISVNPMHDFRFELKFADGRRAIFDASPCFHIPVFKRLKDPVYFSKAIVNHGTVAWPDGLDFDPDTLYLDSSSF
jgi:Protein of unknown function (DUF2442)